MRHLDRNKVVAPVVLTDPGSAGETETIDAIAFFSRKKIPNKEKFKYEAYSHDTVKQALSDISNDKCAYCEIDVLAGHDGDVEHFRPKGEINNKGEKPVKPGYYWLGAKWENLHLSCAHCNQARIQLTTTGKRTIGKKNQFPLSEPKKRIKSHKRSIKDEEPYRLLLDPCIDKPENHLWFDRDGIIYPGKPGREKSKMGETSIEVFALVRDKLVRSRKKHAVRVETTLSMMQTYIDDYDNAIKLNLSAAEIAKKKKLLEAQIDKLKVFTNTDAVYSLLSLCIVQEYLGKYNIKYNG